MHGVGDHLFRCLPKRGDARFQSRFEILVPSSVTRCSVIRSFGAQHSRHLYEEIVQSCFDLPPISAKFDRTTLAGIERSPFSTSSRRVFASRGAQGFPEPVCLNRTASPASSCPNRLFWTCELSVKSATRSTRGYGSLQHFSRLSR